MTKTFEQRWREMRTSNSREHVTSEIKDQINAFENWRKKRKEIEK